MHYQLARRFNKNRCTDDNNVLAIEELADRYHGSNDFGSGRKQGEAKRFESTMSGWFGRMVCDESHAAETIRTCFHQAIAQLEAAHNWVLTATPLYNRAFDMCGYLAILYSGLRMRTALRFRFA